MNYFAQTASLPGDSASRAEDFQPPTRNPQTAGGDLQSGASIQSVEGQDILNNGNARILVPTGEAAEPAPTPLANSGGINWLVVLAISAVLVIAVELLIRRRERTKRSSATSAPEAINATVDTVHGEYSAPQNPTRRKKTRKQRRRRSGQNRR